MTPHYFSTRDASRRLLSFQEAMLTGLASDGGLFIPDRIPDLPAGWRQAGTFGEMAEIVLKPWFGSAMKAYAPLLREALSFPVPLKRLPDDRFVLELFHGPTLAFKDVGARVMARLMSHELASSGHSLTILVATSGDTGSAVADGFAGREGLEVVLLYPKGMVSEVQERQLVVARPGVRSYAVTGTFDDCQRLAKEAFVDPELEPLGLSSANSINVGRLLPQLLHYLWGVVQLWRQVGSEPPPLVVVPSGNLGNMTGAVLAHLMGLPVAGLVAAHNANDFFPRFLLAERKAYAFEATRETLSNAMDVGAPSNFERLDALLGERLPELLSGEVVDDATTLERIRRTFDEEGYLVCPHTAVALEAVARQRRKVAVSTPILTVATAHPAKFPDVIRRSLAGEPPVSDRLEALKDRPTRVKALPPSLEALKGELLAPSAAG